MTLRISLADNDRLQWAQQQVSLYHYLKKPVDVRSSPVSYLVYLNERRVGCLIFGRPECPFVRGWYGSVEQKASGVCRLTRWEVLNLARVWLHPDIQKHGACYVENAASVVIAKALRSIVFDYLLLKPPVFLDEPFALQECLSYCYTPLHTGTIYRASNFRLVRENARGIHTYARPLRTLTSTERRTVEHASLHSLRAKRYRAARAVSMIEQTPLF